MKLYYSAIFIALFGFFSSQAQIADYSVSPDWTAVDLNGVTHNLYNNLDSGYGVFMDLSTAWCAPCWTIHQSGLLQDLHDMYGAEGTNELRVFYIESEGTNSEDQLHGIGTSGGGANRATDTQGDWVTGHTFPFIDDASIAVPLYELQAYPTMTVVGLDRLTKTWVGSPGPSVDEVYNYIKSTSPAVEGSDTRLIAYDGPTLSVCGSFAPSVLIQNHGTDTITTLDFDVVGNGSTVIASHNWTGMLLPYETTSVVIDEIDGTGYDSIHIEVTTVDDVASNNSVGIEGLTVLKPNTSNNVFNVDNADVNSLALPDGLSNDPISDWSTLAVNKTSFNGVSHEVGGFGNSEFSLLFNFYNNQTGSSIVYLDKIDMTTVLGDPYLFFSHAYTQYIAENDRLLIQASNDCGASWTTVFDEEGSALATVPAQTGFFVPTADQWQYNMIDMTQFATETDLIIRFIGVTDYGNTLFVDDIRVEEVSAVDEIPSIEMTQLYPNPTGDVATLEIDLTSSEDVNIFMVDQLGRVVKNVYTGTLEAGNNALEVDVSNIASGLYNVVIRHMEENKVNTLKLQVR